MNTPAHLLTGAALFGRKGGRAVLWSAMLGALLPDLSLYVLTFWALNVQGLGPNVVFGELYFSDSWQRIFAVDNSLPLWAGMLVLALVSRRAWAVALCAAALLHVGLDFLMHAGDGRPNFWPFSDWVFHSPVSYWDSRHHAHLLMPFTFAACLASCVALWPGRSWAARGLLGVLLIAESWTVWQMFTFF